MKNYRITFTPMEPYFFGNEKTFKYPNQKNGGDYGKLYYIRSELTPSQSTFLGALRYILLPVKRHDFSYTQDELKENAAAAGSSSFDISSAEVQSFGAISRISPMFITHGEDIFIPAPMDHNLNAKTDDKKYSPFSDYAEMSTPYGRKLYARDYYAKRGVAGGMFMNISDHSMADAGTLFEKTVRIGIKRGADSNGLFKKEYCRLADGYAFAVDAVIDTDILCEDVLSVIKSGTIVYLGQNKSVFSVSFDEREEDITDLARKSLEEFKPEQGAKMYVLSDSIAGEHIYDGTLWSSVAVRDYRSFIRKSGAGNRVEKGSALYKMIRAGSVIITDDPEGWMKNYKCVHGYKNASRIGYCCIVVIGG